MQELISGYRKFLQNYYQVSPNIYQQLRDRQKPDVLFLACCDSRVDPAILTSALPGQIFVVRNIANMVPVFNKDAEFSTESMAAIEFAVTQLDLKEIIVLGHENCAGVNALALNTMNDAISCCPEHWSEHSSDLISRVNVDY